MNIEHLRYVVATYEMGSFRSAARMLYCTPQAVSQGVRKVEQEFCTKIFTITRSGTSIEATPAAAGIVAWAVVFLADYDRMKESAKNLSQN